jgi:hypothetical protein
MINSLKNYFLIHIYVTKTTTNQNKLKKRYQSQEFSNINRSINRFLKIEFLVPNFLFYWRVTSIFHKNLFLELFFKGFLAVFKVFHEFLRVFELIIGNCVYFCHVLKNSKANIKNGLLYFLILSSSPEVSIPDSYKT